MSGRISFGCDFLYLANMLQPQWSSIHDVDLVRATSRLFLVQWGFSLEEINKAEAILWDRIDAGALDDLSAVVQRIVNHFKKDRSAQERLIAQLAAIAVMDCEYSDRDAAFVGFFQEAFDLGSAEFFDLYEQGRNLATALLLFGRAYSIVQLETAEKSVESH